MVADLVPQGARLADVGTDHAYLPTALIQEGKIPFAIAADLRQGPLASAKATVRRAGLDYWPMVDLRVYDGLEQFFTEHPAPDLWLATTKAPRSYDQAQFRDGCYLFFGKETAGLPLGFREEHRERCIRIPMRPDARSLNLANSVAVVAYEALRQLGFPGLSGQGEMAEGL